jgi:hypothetical protein
VDLRRRSPAVFRLLLALFAVHVIFSANYQVADRYTFHVFSYVVFALAMAAGFGRLLAAMDATAISRRDLRVAAAAGIAAAVVSPVAIYAVAPRTLRAAGFDEAAVSIPPLAREGGTDRAFLNPNRRGTIRPNGSDATRWLAGTRRARPGAQGKRSGNLSRASLFSARGITAV